MNQHERREAMRRQEQAFGAVVCLVCAIIISCVIIGAGFRRVSQMIDAAQLEGGKAARLDGK